MDLSIIIPVYNAEALIERCLKSIFDQENFNFSFEVIVVNDGSKDNSLQKLKEAQQIYTNLKIIDQPNSGAGTARNTGLNAATANYIWFIDIDDYIEPDAFKALQERCIYSAEEKTIGFNYYKVSAQGVKKPANAEINYKDVEELKGVDYLDNNKPYYLWVIIYQRSIIEQNKLRFIDGIKNLEDLEFSIRYFNICPKIEYHNINLYNYYENDLSTSRNKSRDNLVKLADDTIVVHKSISGLITSLGNSYNAIIIRNLFNISVLGFFYSLVQNPYKYDEISRYYKLYFNKKYLPIPIIKRNKKFHLFSILLNNKYLFYSMLIVKKAFK